MKNTLLASVLLVAGFAFSTSAGAGDDLADRHIQNALTCPECHVEKVPSRAPKMDTCLSCHSSSYEELGKASAGKKPNPHYTHVGDKECTVCHKAHKAPEFFCNDCHKFKVQMPKWVDSDLIPYKATVWSSSRGSSGFLLFFNVRSLIVQAFKNSLNSPTS
jgi:fumarate reductase flavoprotein subunit